MLIPKRRVCKQWHQCVNGFDCNNNSNVISHDIYFSIGLGTHSPLHESKHKESESLKTNKNLALLHPERQICQQWHTHRHMKDVTEMR